MQNPLYGWVGEGKKDNLKRAILLAIPLNKLTSQSKCAMCSSSSLNCFSVYEHYKLTCLYRIEYIKPYVIYFIENLYGLSGATLTCTLLTGEVDGSPALRVG